MGRWYVVDSEHQPWSNHIHVCRTAFLRETVLPLLRHALRDATIDWRYHALEDVLQRPTAFLGQNAEVDACIDAFVKRRVYSGAGRFFHNK